MKKVDKSDEFVRRAIWDVYKHKCFYTGSPLEYVDMELDHIIPQSLGTKPHELTRIKTACNLPDDFEIDSLYNLVPTSKFENRRKSDMEYEHNDKIYFLSHVKKNVPAIEKKIEQFKKNRNYIQHIAILKTFVDDQKDRNNRENFLEGIVNFLDNNEDFIEQEQECNNDGKFIFKKYTKRIGLESIMPKFSNPETTCVIQFRTLKVRNCMLLLDNKTILSELFTGLFTDPIYGTRGFLCFNQKQDKNDDVFNLEEAFIQISNNKIHLVKDDIYTLCEIIDIYATKYIECILNIENILNSHNYSLSKRRNNYKMINISYQEWRKLVEFASKHDVDKGSSRWHIFDRNNNYIKVYTEKEMPTLNPGFHGFFKAEYHDDIVLYPHFGLGSLCITYEFMEDLDNRGMEFINQKENWDVETAYNWLTNRFIPKVLGSGWNKKYKKRNDLQDYFDNNDLRVCYLSKKSCTTFHELFLFIQVLQFHYHIHPHSKYRIHTNDLKGIYDSIVLCLKSSKEADLHYLCEKLYLNKCRSMSELINSIEEISEQLKDTTITGFGVDFLFRSLYAALNSNNLNITFKDIEFIRNSLNFFVKIHDREVLIEKYAIDFING